MWKVALRESDAETHLARCLDRFAVSMDDEADVCALRETIMLTALRDAAGGVGSVEERCSRPVERSPRLSNGSMLESWKS